MLTVFFLKGGSDENRQALDSILRELRMVELENYKLQTTAKALGQDVGVTVTFAKEDCRRLRNGWTGTPGAGGS